MFVFCFKISPALVSLKQISHNVPERLLAKSIQLKYILENHVLVIF